MGGWGRDLGGCSLGWEVFVPHLELGWEAWTPIFPERAMQGAEGTYSEVVLGLATSASWGRSPHTRYPGLSHKQGQEGMQGGPGVLQTGRKEAAPGAPPSPVASAAAGRLGWRAAGRMDGFCWARWWGS